VFCWIAPQLDHAREYLFRFFFGGKTLQEDLVIYKELFSKKKNWNFKAIPNKNHFDVCLKQTCSEIQAILMDRLA
jgi:hypothetical protein